MTTLRPGAGPGSGPGSGPGPGAPGQACEEMRLLIQADLDGELDAAATAVLTAHVAECPGCREEQAAMAALSQRLRAELPREPAPADLRRRIEADLRLRAAPPPARGFRRLRPLLPFGAGAAIAAGVALLALPLAPRTQPGDRLEADLVAGHIRALQPGHLIDVASTDKHTVKPWFDGKLDYAPPVPDFAHAGFPLVGGRLDYIDGRAVAVLVYASGKHLIDVYVWPDRDPPTEGPDRVLGYNVAYWSDHAMRCAAVSDVEPAALARLAALWTAQAS